MAENKKQEQVRDDHYRVLGPTLGALYHALYQDVTWLHAKWKQYRILFAESSDRIDLLNTVAAFFFRVTQDVLWEDVVLHIARVTDPPRSGGKDNLTLLRLQDAITDPVLSAEIAVLVERARSAAKFARDWRNRHLAHRDLLLAIGAGATALPGISRADVEDALSNIRSVLNKIESRFFQNEVVFEAILASSDGNSLIHYLQLAVATEQGG